MNSDATIALQYYIPGTHDLIVDVILLALLFGERESSLHLPIHKIITSC